MTTTAISMAFAGFLQAQDATALPLHAIAPETEDAQVGRSNEEARPQSRWFVRSGILGAIYHPHATIATNGQVIPGATATVTNNVTLTFDVGYELTEHVSLLMMLGLPPKPTVTGEGTVSSLSNLGWVRYGPAILTATYRVTQWGAVRPYAGLGAAYAIILRNFDGSVSELRVHNNWGFVLQAGVEYQLSKRWELYLDYKRLWLYVKAEGFIDGNAPVKARVTLDPTLISAGIKFRFD